MLCAKALFTVLLATAALVHAKPTATSGLQALKDGLTSIDPQGIALKPLEKRAPSPSADLSNAQRLARGLPLRKPKPRSDKAKLRFAERAVPSACPTTTVSGVLQVTSADTGSELGYVGAAMTTYGHYGVSTNLAGALRVSIGTSSCSSASTASQLDIATSNGAAAYPHLGLVAGAANTAPTNNLAAGSSNYAYLSGVAQTSPGAPAVAAGNTYTAASGRAAGTESAIWTYDAASGAVGAQWINGDGSVAPTYVVYSQADSSLLATGDVARFRDAFGSANKPVVTFKLITAIAS